MTIKPCLMSYFFQVTVSDAHLLPVTIECVSCSVRSSANHISYNAPIILSGRCGQCDDQAQVTIVKLNAKEILCEVVFNYFFSR